MSSIIIHLLLLLIVGITGDDSANTFCQQLKSGAKKILLMGESTNGSEFIILASDLTGLRVASGKFHYLYSKPAQPRLYLGGARFFQVPLKNKSLATPSSGKGVLFIHAQSSFFGWSGREHVAWFDGGQIVTVALDDGAVTTIHFSGSKKKSADQVFFIDVPGRAELDRTARPDVLLLKDGHIVEGSWSYSTESGTVNSISLTTGNSNLTSWNTPVEGGWTMMHVSVTAQNSWTSHYLIFYGFNSATNTITYKINLTSEEHTFSLRDFFLCSTPTVSTISTTTERHPFDPHPIIWPIVSMVVLYLAFRFFMYKRSLAGEGKGQFKISPLSPTPTPITPKGETSISTSPASPSKEEATKKKSKTSDTPTKKSPKSVVNLSTTFASKTSSKI